jgi:transcriptional regulator of heat shock response
LTRTGHVNLPREYPLVVIQEAGELLSRRVAGHTVHEIRHGLLDTLDLIHTPATQCAACLAEAGKPIFDSLEKGEMQLDGLGNVLDEPELHDPDPLKALLRFIESPAAIRVSFGKLGEVVGKGYGVWIGEEIPLQGMRSFTILTSGFKLDGRDGLLAVLGPRRMSYQRAFHGMDLVKKALLDAGDHLGS